MHYFYKSLIIGLLLLGGLISCSKEDRPPEPEGHDYFVEVTGRQDWSRETFAERLKLGDDNALLKRLPQRAIRTEAIIYRTEDPVGDKIRASGIITYPVDGQFKGVVVAPHFSIGANREAPSSVMATIESGLALFGYLVITPDNLGFGATRDLPQTYLHAETAGQVGVDMVLAVQEYMDSLQFPVREQPLTVAGYSQGAYSALAFTQKAEVEYGDRMQIDRVFAGGGPYEPDSMFDLFLEEDVMANPATVLLTVIGLDYGDQLNLDYTQIFQQPLLSHYQEWLVSKNYTLGEINKLLGTNKLSELMHPDMFAPEMNLSWQKLMRSLRQNSLLRQAPRAPLLLVHGTKDRIVPYVNAQRAHDIFQKAGTSVRLIPVDADHQEAAISFYIQVILELNSKKNFRQNPSTLHL